MTRSDWTFTSTASDGTVTTLRVETSDDFKRGDDTYHVYYAAYEDRTDRTGDFLTTRADVTVVRDPWGDIIRFDAVESWERCDHDGTRIPRATVSARTRRDIRELLGNEAIRDVMDGIRRYRRAA